MEINLTAIQLGFISGLVTELFKLIPLLNQNKLFRILTAIAVCFAGTWYFVGFSAIGWVEVFVYAVASYGLVLKPIAAGLGSKTQKAADLGGTRG